MESSIQWPSFRTIDDQPMEGPVKGPSNNKSQQVSVSLRRTHIARLSYWEHAPYFVPKQITRQLNQLNSSLIPIFPKNQAAFDVCLTEVTNSFWKLEIILKQTLLNHFDAQLSTLLTKLESHSTPSEESLQVVVQYLNTVNHLLEANDKWNLQSHSLEPRFDVKKAYPRYVSFIIKELNNFYHIYFKSPNQTLKNHFYLNLCLLLEYLFNDFSYGKRIESLQLYQLFEALLPSLAVSSCTRGFGFNNKSYQNVNLWQY